MRAAFSPSPSFSLQTVLFRANFVAIRSWVSRVGLQRGWAGEGLPLLTYAKSHAHTIVPCVWQLDGLSAGSGPRRRRPPFVPRRPRYATFRGGPGAGVDEVSAEFWAALETPESFDPAVFSSLNVLRHCYALALSGGSPPPPPAPGGVFRETLMRLNYRWDCCERS